MELELLPKADSLSVVLGNLEGPERSEKSQHLGRKKGGGVWGECIWDGGGEMRSQLPGNLSGQERRGYRGREEGHEEGEPLAEKGSLQSGRPHSLGI